MLLFLFHPCFMIHCLINYNNNNSNYTTTTTTTNNNNNNDNNNNNNNSNIIISIIIMNVNHVNHQMKMISVLTTTIKKDKYRQKHWIQL